MEREECGRCCGNGELVTDWDRYLNPLPWDKADTAVEPCPDCHGYGFFPTPDD